MKIEAGKYYKTRDGRKVGPMKPKIDGILFKCGPFGDFYYENGKHWRCYETPDDIISEWKEEIPHPIRTVTRKEIVPGVYGHINIFNTSNKYVGIRINSNMDATELREAAHTLNQIAEALEDD